MTRSLDIISKLRALDEEMKRQTIQVDEKGTVRISDEDGKKVAAPYLTWRGYEDERHYLGVCRDIFTDLEWAVVWASGPHLDFLHRPANNYEWLVKYRSNEMTFDEAKSIFKKLSSAATRQGLLGKASKPSDWQKLESKELTSNDSDMGKMKAYLENEH